MIDDAEHRELIRPYGCPMYGVSSKCFEDQFAIIQPKLTNRQTREILLCKAG